MKKTMASYRKHAKEGDSAESSEANKMAKPATSEAVRSEITADVVTSGSQQNSSSSLRERSIGIDGASEPQAPTGKERQELDMNLASMLVDATLEGDEEAPLLKIDAAWALLFQADPWKAATSS